MEAANYAKQIQLEDFHWWYTARRHILSHLIRNLSLPADSEVLDVGCGSGGNFALFAPFKTVFGIEMDDDSRVCARARGFTDVQFGALPDQFPYAGRKFNLITMLDVLEHIEDDESTVRVLKEHLAPGGFLVVTVPAFQFMWSESDVTAHHKRRYAKARLRKIAANAGLKEVYLTYFNTTLFPMIAGIRVLKNIVGSKSADVQNHSRLMNRMLYHAFASENIWIQQRWGFPFGVSLLLIGQNP